MDDTAAGLRRRLFDAAARMRKQRQEPPTPKGITPAEMYAIMAVSRLEGEGRKVRSGDIAKCGQATPSAVSQTLKSLEEKGLIKRDALKSRSIALTYPLDHTEDATNIVHAQFDDIVSVPLVGDVAAGVPILAEQNITNTMSLPIEIVGDAPSFMLSVHGESMIEAGINDGDYVVVKEQPVANNGDIVVAIIDDGATVKRFYKEQDHIRLQPENSSMDPIITTDCSIAGKVVAVFRRL